MTEKSKKAFIKTIIDRLSLEAKIGATLTLHCRGTVFLPIWQDAIMKHNVGGLRIDPSLRYQESGLTCQRGEGVYRVAPGSGHLKRFSLSNLRHLYKRYQDMAVSRPSGVPLHMAFDQEGEYSGDLKTGGGPVFPPPMGLVASGDPSLCYEVARSIARVARSCCANVIHSPCLDVNVDPSNPEINTRSYSDRPEVVAEYAAESARGFRDGGVAATGKHFPGRGNSSVDAHEVVPVIESDYDTMWNVELLPYKLLIAKGLLPAIMTAHSVYPALDPDNVATLSPKILQDVLREKLGFEGVITADAIGMNGITLRDSVPVGTAKALVAGVDMVLLRMSTAEPVTPYLPKVIAEVRRWVESGKLREEDLNRKVERILSMKYDLGLFDEVGWSEDVSEVIADEQVQSAVRRSSTTNVFVLREEQGVLPLPRGVRALVIEQTFDPFLCPNDDNWPPGVLYDSLLRYSTNLSYFELAPGSDDAEKRQALELAAGYDTVIVTNWTRRSAGSILPLVRELATKIPGKVILLANTPYEAFSVPAEAKNVIVHFGVTSRSVEVAADVLFGGPRPAGSWPIDYKP